MNNYWYLIAVLLLCNLSCAIDDDIMFDDEMMPEICQPEFIGTFDLLPTSDDVFPYVDFFSTTNFIYVNEAGEEITYNMDTLLVLNTTRTFRQPCPEDENLELELTYSGGFKGANFSSEDNPLLFQLNLNNQISFIDPTPESVFDVLTILARDVELQELIAFSVFSLVADARESDQPLFEPEFFESVEINGRTLVDVFKTNFFNPTIDAELYYSKELGIVAFKDLDDVQWVLDRIE